MNTTIPPTTDNVCISYSFIIDVYLSGMTLSNTFTYAHYLMVNTNLDLTKKLQEHPIVKPFVLDLKQLSNAVFVAVTHQKQNLSTHNTSKDKYQHHLTGFLFATSNHRSEINDKGQLHQRVSTHSDIHNASSTDLSSPSSMATILRGEQQQLYPHVFKQISMNKGNIQVTPDAIQSPSARVTSPEHNHAAQRRLRTIILDVY